MAFKGGVCAYAISYSYNMACPHVRGDNPRALASGLSFVQVDKYAKLSYTTYISVDLAHYEILRVKVGQVGISTKISCAGLAT